jgi:hypothetical protein
MQAIRRNREERKNYPQIDERIADLFPLRESRFLKIGPLFGLLTADLAEFVRTLEESVNL